MQEINEPKKIIIHCSASPNGKYISVEEIRKDHMANRGFSDIGYHWVIEPDGDTVLGRLEHVIGAHCEGNNRDSIGICLIGLDKFTNKQFNSLKTLLNLKLNEYNLRIWDIYCHNQFKTAMLQGKTCPNIQIQRLIMWYSFGLDEAIKDNILNA